MQIFLHYFILLADVGGVKLTIAMIFMLQVVITHKLSSSCSCSSFIFRNSMHIMVFIFLLLFSKVLYILLFSFTIPFFLTVAYKKSLSQNQQYSLMSNSVFLVFMHVHLPALNGFPYVSVVSLCPFPCCF